MAAAVARGGRALTRRRAGARPSATVALGLLPAAFIVVFFLWPIGALIHRAVQTSAGAASGSASTGSGTGMADLLSRTNALELLAITLGQALASTLIAVIVAAPIVWLVARVDLPGSTALMVLVTVPFVLPTVVVGIIFRAVLTGPLAFLGIQSGLTAVLAAHAFLNVAVIVRIVGAAWRSVDQRAVDAARVLGAGPFTAFRTVVLPRLAPSIGASAALVFLFCSTSFGVIIILGDGTLRTLETEIYTRAIGFFQIPEAVALSMIQIVVVIAALLVTRLFTDPAPGSATGGRDRRLRPHGWRWVPVLAVVGYAIVVLLGPILVLVLRSVRPGTGGAVSEGWTLDGYRGLTRTVNGVTPIQTLGYSLLAATAAMLIATAIGLLAAIALHRAAGPVGVVANVIAMIPLGISAVTLGFGYLLILATLPAQVARSSWVIPCVQALIAIPVVIRILLPALEAIPPRMREAAATLGASPWQVFRTVDAPLIGRSLGAAGGFAFVMALGEFGASGFLARPDTTTLPVLIGSALNRPGADNLATAMAASTLLVVVTAAAVVAVEVVRPRSGAMI